MTIARLNKIDEKIATLVAERELIAEQLDASVKAANPDCTCRHGLSKHGSDGCFAKNGHDIYCDCSAVPVAIQEAAFAELLNKYGCRTHKHYEGDCPPGLVTSCESCWRLYVRLNP